MTVISNNDIARAIYLASLEEKEQSRFAAKVIDFLARKKLLSRTPRILECLDKIINLSEEKIVAKIWSAAQLDEKTRKEIIHAVTKRYAAKKVSLIESIDKKLLGGLKIEVDDEVADWTIKNRIGKLQEYLTRA